jgi:hypothetical protein
MRTCRGVASIVFNHYTLHVEGNIREWNFRRKRMYFAEPILLNNVLGHRPDVKFLYKRVDKSLKSACWQYAKTRKGIYS